MKKLTLFLTLLTMIVNSYAQDTVYVYQENGMLRINNLENVALFMTPSQTGLRLKGLDFILKDGLTKQEYNVGEYDEIFKKDSSGFSTQDLAINYFTGILNRAVNDVNIQDQTSPLIIAWFSNEEASTTLSVLGVIDERTITVTSATGFSAGKYVSIFNIEANRFYLGSVISVLSNVVTLDTPLDFAYPEGSFVTSGSRNMNVDGSSTPVIYGVRNTEEQIGSAFDITRIIIYCEASSSIDLSKFGDIAGGLTNGIVMRKVDGEQRNIFNAKTNGELKNLMYDFDIETASGNQQDGFTGRMTFGGQSKMGVVIRLSAGEDLQIIIQDDLTDLEVFGIICEGHTVED